MIKESYKYTFSDFVFQFYQKNRYGQVAPVSGKIKPLEDEKLIGMQGAWEEYKEMTKKVVEKPYSGAENRNAESSQCLL